MALYGKQLCSHGTVVACMPVLVSGCLAYVTLRMACGLPVLPVNRQSCITLACDCSATVSHHLNRHVRKAAEKLYKDVQDKRSRRNSVRREGREGRERRERPLRGTGGSGSLDRRAMAVEDRNQLSRKLFTITEALNSRSNVRCNPALVRS
jgi:hypothetical protein